MDDAYGGGSITALPIVETQAGDISAYIPTNVISITDGQIFLETDQFFAGQRPAINTGLSVSRVGGAAQIKAIKKLAGKLKIELAQYRELAAFSQFGSDLDQETRDKLDQGVIMMEVLKQSQYSPLPVEHQVLILYAVMNKYLKGIPRDRIRLFERELIIYVENNYPEIFKDIKETKDLRDENVEVIKTALANFKKNF